MEGLPVRQWRRQPTTVNTSPPKEVTLKTDEPETRWTELPMPKGSELYSSMSQAMLRMARRPIIYGSSTKTTDDDKEHADDEDADGDFDTGFTSTRWTQIPKDLEQPELEFLAKRRIALPLPHGDFVAMSATGPLQKAKIRKVDSEGNALLVEALVPEGALIGGSIVEGGDVVTGALAPGTVVEGVGIANAEGVVVIGESSVPTPPRRKPPPPKRKSKGPGRGKRKKLITGSDTGSARPLDGNGSASTVEQAATTLSTTDLSLGGGDGDVEMADDRNLQEDEEGSEDDEDGDDEDGNEKQEDEASDNGGPASLSPPPGQPASRPQAQLASTRTTIPQEFAETESANISTLPGSESSQTPADASFSQHVPSQSNQALPRDPDSVQSRGDGGSRQVFGALDSPDMSDSRRESVAVDVTPAERLISQDPDQNSNPIDGTTGLASHDTESGLSSVAQDHSPFGTESARLLDPMAGHEAHATKVPEGEETPTSLETIAQPGLIGEIGSLTAAVEQDASSIPPGSGGPSQANADGDLEFNTANAIDNREHPTPVDNTEDVAKEAADNAESKETDDLIVAKAGEDSAAGNDLLGSLERHLSNRS